MEKTKLLLGTANRGKVAELNEMLGGLGVELVPLDAVGPFEDVAETGETFAENARLKASAYARQSGMPTLADDSGFEVEALGWRPGVLSARYGGDAAKTFSEKIALLLSEMEQSKTRSRAARFKCAVALAAADGEIVAESEGVVSGSVSDSPSGNGGFGYDPIFVPEGFSKTFAEMSSAEKGGLSHRGRAILQIIPYLRTFLGTLT